MIRQFELVERVKGYDPCVDEEALNRGYVFAMKAHGNQRRSSRHFSVAPDFSQHAIDHLRMLAQNRDGAMIGEKVIGNAGATVLDQGAPMGKALSRNGCSQGHVRQEMPAWAACRQRP